MLSPSKQFIDQINSLRKDFVWRGKRPKIKHSTLIGDYKEGGYKDVDTEVKIVALKIIWINKLMANDFHAWKAIPNFVFDKIGIRSVFHYNFKSLKNTSQKISLLPQFYQELVSFWESVSGKQPSCISEFVGQCIWNNTYIIKQGSTIFYTRLYKSGIMIINDLIDTEGNLTDWVSAKLKFELADQDMMRWLSIVQAIPSTWKKQISNYGRRFNEKILANIVIPNMKVKEVYAKLLRPLVCPKKQLRNFLLMII